MAAFSGNNALPEGWLLCNGTAVSRETYAALFNIIGTTYGTGDGSTTFNLPNLTDRFIQGNETAGTVKSAGLPNIIGEIYVSRYATGPSGTGAFSTGTIQANYLAAGGDGVFTSNLLFNASRSSAVYGASDTVQPPAVTMKYAIYSGVVSKKLWLRTI